MQEEPPSLPHTHPTHTKGMPYVPVETYMEKTCWICHTVLLWEDSHQFPLWQWEFSHPQDMQMTFFICSFYVICIIFSCKSESCQKLTIWGFNIQFCDLSQSITSLRGSGNFGWERVEDTEKWAKGWMMDEEQQVGRDIPLHLNSHWVFIPLDTSTIVAISFLPSAFTDNREDVSVRCHRLFCCYSG